MRDLIDIYLTFLRIGAFTLGGGFAMVPLIQDAAVSKKWATELEMADFVAIGQSLPGVVGINTATAVGKRAMERNGKNGLAGALAATFGMVTPSLVIIVAIAAFFDDFMGVEVLKAAFDGVRPAVAALIAVAAVRMIKTCVVDGRSVFGGVVAVLAFTAVLFLNVPAPYVVLAAGLIGCLRGVVVARKL